MTAIPGRGGDQRARVCRALALAGLVLVGCRATAPAPLQAVAAGPLAPAAPPVFPTEDGLAPGQTRCPVIGNCVLYYRLADEVTDLATARAVRWMRAARDAGARALVLELDTPGGSVEAGFKLIRTIRSLGIPTHCVVGERAYSMGFAILQSCASRLATRRSTLMAHAATLAPRAPGELEDPRTEAEHLKAIARSMAELCAGRMLISPDEYRARTATDWWMDASEAVKQRAVDRVVFDTRSVHKHLSANLQLP